MNFFNLCCQENPILCKNTDEIQLYHKDKEDNTYYKCPDYCLNCEYESYNECQYD